MDLGHALIEVATLYVMIAAFAIHDARNPKTLCLKLSSAPSGYLMSQLLYQIVFTRADSYFTNIASA